ncbi:MAG: hypothetical protein ACOYMA_05350 [Bacteroidia bacterium]
MKSYSKITKWILASTIFVMLSSLKCNEPFTPIYTTYNPVFMKRADLENSITLNAPRTLGSPSKIYSKDNYLFVSEAGLGVHVIDNNDQKKPKNIAFLKVLGCFDMAIKGSILYVDNATDLVALDLSNPEKLVITQRIVNAFPEPVPPDNLAVRPEHSKENRPADMVLVKWNKQ